MINVEIRDHRIYVNAQQTTFRQTPNLGGALAPEGIIVHDTAGGLKAEGSISWLCNPSAKVSAHVVIGRDGDTTQLAPFNRVCWHAGKSSYQGRPNCNLFSIGIEIINPGKLSKIESGVYRNDLGITISEKDGPVERRMTDYHGDGYWLHYSEQQIGSMIALLLALRNAYQGIRFIEPHWFISPGRKINTNPLFPIERVRSMTFGRAVPEGSDGDSDGIVNVHDLNLRGGPGIEHKILGSLSRGTRVLVRDTAMNGLTRWLRVDVPQKGDALSGWVAARYVDVD